MKRKTKKITHSKRKINTTLWTRGILLLGLGLSVWYLPILLHRQPPISTHETTQIVQAEEQHEPDSIEYPSLGIKTPLHQLAVDPFSASSAPTISDALKTGVALVAADTNKQEIASSSMMYIIGHSSDVRLHQYAFIFSSLGKSQIGDVIKITKDGHSYDYKVESTKICAPEDMNCFNSVKPTDEHMQKVVLVTCWPVFTTKNRLLVVAQRSL